MDLGKQEILLEQENPHPYFFQSQSSMKSLYECYQNIRREIVALKSEEKSIEKYFRKNEELSKKPSTIDNADEIPYDPEDSNILLDGEMEDLDIDGSIKSISLSEGEIIDELEFDQFEENRETENDLEELELRKRCLQSLEARVTSTKRVQPRSSDKPSRKRKRRRRRKPRFPVSGILASVSSHKSHRDQTNAFIHFAGAPGIVPPKTSVPPRPVLLPPPPPPLPFMLMRPSDNSFLNPTPWRTPNLQPPVPKFDDDILALFGSHDIDQRVAPEPFMDLTILDNYDHVQMDICSNDGNSIKASTEDEAEKGEMAFDLEEDLNVQLRQLREEVEEHDGERKVDKMGEGIKTELPPIEQVADDHDEELEHTLRRRLLESLKRRKELSISASNSPSYVPDSALKASEVSTPSLPLSPRSDDVKKESNESSLDKAAVLKEKQMKLANLLKMKRATQRPLTRRYVITVDDASSDEELRMRNEIKQMNSDASLKEVMSMKERCNSCISDLHSQVSSDRMEIRNLMKQLHTCRNERKKLTETCKKLRHELDAYEQNLRKVRSTEFYFSDRLRRIREKVKERQNKYKDMNNDLAQLIFKIRDHPEAKEKFSMDLMDGEVPTKKRKMTAGNSIQDTEGSEKATVVKRLRHVQSAPVISAGSLTEAHPESCLVDPYKVVCPYHLHGKCNQQTDCPYQHPKFPNSSKFSKESSLKLQSTSNEAATATEKSMPMGSGLCTKYRCPACEMILRIPTLHLRQDVECRSCSDDHITSLHHCMCRLEWCRTHGKNTSIICKKIADLVENVKLSSDFTDFNVFHLKHCLLGWLSVKEDTNPHLYTDALDCIKPMLARLDYSEESVWCVYSQLVSLPARQSLLLTAFDTVKQSDNAVYALKIVMTLIQLHCISGHPASASSFLVSLLHNQETARTSGKGRMYLWSVYLYLTATNDAPFFEVTDEKMKLVSASDLLVLIPNRCLDTRRECIKAITYEALYSVSSNSDDIPIHELLQTKFEIDEDCDAFFSIVEVYLKLVLYNVPDDEDHEIEKEQQDLFQSLLKFILIYFGTEKCERYVPGHHVVTLFIYYLTWVFQHASPSKIDWEWFETLFKKNFSAYTNLLPLFVYMSALNIGFSDENRTLVEDLIKRLGRWLYGLTERHTQDDNERLYGIFLGLECGPFPVNGKCPIERSMLEEGGSLVYLWLSLSMLLHLQNRTGDVYQIITEKAVPSLQSRQKDVSVLLCFALWSLKTGLESQSIDMTYYTKAVDHCLSLVCKQNSVSTALKVVNEIEIGYLLAGDQRNIPVYRTCAYFGRQGYPIIRHMVGDLISLKEYRAAFSICQDLSNEKYPPCGERFWMLYLRTAELCELSSSIQLDISENACQNVPMSRRLWNSYRNMARYSGTSAQSSVLKDIEKKMIKYGIVASQSQSVSNS